METSASARTPARLRAPIGPVVAALIFELIFWATMLIGRAFQYGMFGEIYLSESTVLSVAWSFLPIVAALIACKVRESRRLISIGTVYAAFTAISVYWVLGSFLFAFRAVDHSLIFEIAYLVCYLLLMLNAFAFRKKALFIIPVIILFSLLLYDAFVIAREILELLMLRAYAYQYGRSCLIFQGLQLLTTVGVMLLHNAMLIAALRGVAAAKASNNNKTGGKGGSDDGDNNDDGGQGGDFGDYENEPAPEDAVIF